MKKIVHGLIFGLLLASMWILVAKAEYLHDVAVTDVSPPAPTVDPVYAIPINCTVENQGDFTETFNVTLYYELAAADPIIGTQTVSLASGENTTLTFEWNTTDCFGEYIVTAYAHPVLGETDLADNNLTCQVRVDLRGNIEPVRVDWRDLLILARAYGSSEGDRAYDPSVDLNEDGEVNWRDLLILAQSYGSVY